MTTRGDRAIRLAAALAFFLGLAALLAVIGAREFTSPDAGNPYALDLNPFRRIDPALVKFREAGSFPVPLLEIRALAVGDGDDVLVGGRDERPALLRFDSGGRLTGKTPLEDLPHCIAPAPGGKVYLGMKNRVEVLIPGDPEGTTWAPLGEKAFVTSIAAGAEDVFVADGGQRLVWRFGHDGALKGIVGRRDPASGEEGFLVPGPCFDVALGPDNEFWTVDPGRHRVQNRTRDGRVLATWGRYGFDIEGFSGC